MLLLEWKEFDMAAYFRFREKELAAERPRGSRRNRKRVLMPLPEEEKKEPEEVQEIHFTYNPKGEYAFLSAYYDAPFTVRGKMYKTVQHYYQAQKFIGNEFKEYNEKVINATDPFEAKKVSKEFAEKIQDSAYWKEWKEERRLDAMRRAIKEKFEQHPELKKKLIATGDAILVEEEEFNPYWYIKMSQQRIGMEKEKARRICSEN
eukprot:TRINITY_DN120260_c1_g1_i1.p6 TRINITY_DN120260_c1_g1~~TRINITY_DN120260_c1_g1_i1.p6  ORF type:complete len:205 (-),score=52.04 TRINITY_DN120260_c1_g1_i1:106-720(-)